tara:strand:- start:3902 stop:4486 length:585 start_codon:yes stop_codon:yes gene_type:complete
MVYRVKPGSKKLTEKQRAAINAYFENGYNKKNALLQAGYSLKMAENGTDQVFRAPRVKAEIKRRMTNVDKKADLTVELLIKQLMRRMFSGDTLAEYKVVQPDGTLTWDFTGAPPEVLALVSELSVEFYTEGRGPGAVEVKKFRVKEPDVQQAIMALARHMGMFNDSLEVKGDLVSRLQAGREQSRQANEDEEKE